MKKKNKKKMTKKPSGLATSHGAARGASVNRLKKALACYKNDQFQEALALLEKIPGNSREKTVGMVDHLKASILFNLGDMTGAVEASKMAVAVAPENVEFLNTLGVALDRIGMPLEGLNYLSKASLLEPARLQTFTNMGAVLWKMERHAQSLTCYRKALELDSSNFDLVKTIAYNYYLLGDLEQAASYYEQALLLEGDHGEIWSGIGTLFQSKGDGVGASGCYKKAMEVNPRYYTAYELYVHSGDIPDDERHVMAETLVRFLEMNNLTVSDQRHIHFTLGRIYHDLKDFDRAFYHYGLANEFRGKVLGKIFSLAQYEKEIEEIKSIFSKPFFKKRFPGCSSSQQPVFVVGMPRSGTTLLEQIVSSHSKGFGAGELPAIKKIATEWGGLAQHKTFDHTLALIDEERVTSQAEYYLSQLRRHAPSSAERIVDKFPHNFQFLWCIAILFPDAPIIHCRRDPRDTCLSCFVTNFNSGHGYKHDLFTLGRYYRVYEEVMEHWKEVIPNPILTVQYEDLIQDPEKISRQVIEHIGLEWEADCLKLRSKQHFSQTASNVQIRKGIYRSAVQRWKKYEKHLKPLLQGLGE